MRVFKEMYSGVKIVFADGGNRGRTHQSCKKEVWICHQVVISAYKEQGFRPIQKRWIVERDVL